MTIAKFRFAPLFVVTIALAGCADEGGYPSLAPRAVEKIDLGEPAFEPDAPVAADPALDAAIASAVTRREAAARTFAVTATDVERQARRATRAAVGSSAWLDAQVALAGLDEARSAHATASEALEELAATRAQTLAPPYPALERALAEARAETAAETKRSDAIAALLPAA